MKKHSDGLICRSCLYTFKTIHAFLAKKYGITGVYNVLSFLCSFAMDNDVCHGVIQHYGDVVITALIERYMNEKYVCTKLYMCSTEHYIELDADKYAYDLLSDKPKLVEKKLKLEGKDSENLKVLHVSDIHVDLMYLEVNIVFLF